VLLTAPIEVTLLQNSLAAAQVEVLSAFGAFAQKQEDLKPAARSIHVVQQTRDFVSLPVAVKHFPDNVAHKSPSLVDRPDKGGCAATPKGGGRMSAELF